MDLTDSVSSDSSDSESDFDVNSSNWSNEIYPIHAACMTNRHNKLIHLLDRKKDNDPTIPDINGVDENGFTALMLACKHNRVRGLRTLINHGANLNLHYIIGGAKNGYTALMIACELNRRRCVRTLLEQGADPNLKAQWNETNEPLAPRNTTSCAGRSINDRLTALHVAAYRCHHQCVRILLENGADANIICGRHQTPLHAALDYFYDLSSRCVHHLSPVTAETTLRQCKTNVFSLALVFTDDKCLQALINQGKGVDVNFKHTAAPAPTQFNWIMRYYQGARFSSHITPLTLAGLYKSEDRLVQILIEAGAHVNATDHLELPPLLPVMFHDMIYWEGIKLCNLLFDKGAKMNLYHPRVQGNLTLIGCMEYKEMLTIMLKRGAEADSLFLQTNSYRCKTDVSDSEENDGDPDSEEYDDEDKRMRVLFHFLREINRNKVASVVEVLLRFACNVSLDPRIQSIVTRDQWKSLLEITDSPRSLLHSCRHALRKHIVDSQLKVWRIVPLLPLPQIIIDYLLYEEKNSTT